MNQGSFKPDGPSVGLGVLGFFFPLIGAIVYLVMRPQKPIAARSVGAGALVGFSLQMIAFILFCALVANSMRSNPQVIKASATMSAEMANTQATAAAQRNAP